jgi:hypothetical protein
LFLLVFLISEENDFVLETWYFPSLVLEMGKLILWSAMPRIFYFTIYFQTIRRWSWRLERHIMHVVIAMFGNVILSWMSHVAIFW